MRAYRSAESEEGLMAVNERSCKVVRKRPMVIRSGRKTEC
jgi:hypothetical protein